MDRPSRAHWLLLALLLVTVCVVLGCHHLVRPDSLDDPRAVSAGDRVPDEVAELPAVVDPDGGKTVDTARVPDKTAVLIIDGVDPVWTPKIMDVLDRQGVRGTFFLNVGEITDQPRLVRAIQDRGHSVGLREAVSADPGEHFDWRLRLDGSLARLTLAGVTGRSVRMMRPNRPAGVDNNAWAGMRRVGESGYATVLPNVDGKDQLPGANGAKVRNSVVGAGPVYWGDGAAVLLRGTGGDRTATVDGLTRFVPALKAKGYRFTTVDRLPGVALTANAGLAERLLGVLVLLVLWFAGAVNLLLQVLVAVSVLLVAGRVFALLWIGRRHVRYRRLPIHHPVTEPVSVLVPAHNEEESIAATVMAIANSDHPHIEILVIDDGSTDGTAARVRELRLPNLRLLRQPNGGKASALNTGIKEARHELIVMVDADTIVATDAVREIIQLLSDPSVGAVSGNAKVGNPRGLLARYQQLEYATFNLDRRFYDVMECMPTVPGALGAYRREVLVDLHGLTSDTVAEDTDITMAAIRRGWRVVYEENAVAWTEAPKTMGQWWKQRHRWSFGVMQSMWKHRSAMFDRGPSGRLGRRGLPYVFAFQIFLPLATPFADLFAIYSLLSSGNLQIAGAFGVLLVLQLTPTVYALWLDGDRRFPVWAVLGQQLIYRQAIWMVVFSSVITALTGRGMGWHRPERTGEMADAYIVRRTSGELAPWSG